jgi:hypothetical protein
MHVYIYIYIYIYTYIHMSVSMSKNTVRVILTILEDGYVRYVFRPTIEGE